MSEAAKWCLECGTEKSLSEFYAIGSYCKPCTKIITWRNKIMREYGLTKAQYVQMLSAQDGRCPICSAAFGETAPNVDHCHATGRVRGILCKRCNLALGVFGDDPQRIRQAIAYLTLNRTSSTELN